MGFFDNFFSFNVSRPYPFGWVWNLFTLCFATAVMAFMFLWAAATAGYETIAVSNNNYNLHQTAWHTVFTGKTGDLCAKRLLSVGDRVYTHSGVVPWTIVNWRKRSTGEFVWAVDYASQEIESCFMDQLVMNSDMATETSTNNLRINCTMGDLEIKLAAELVIPLNPILAEALYASLGFTDDKLYAVGWNGLFDLRMSNDAIYVLEMAGINQSSNHLAAFGVMMNGTEFCGQQVTSDDMSKCTRTFPESVGTFLRYSDSPQFDGRVAAPIPTDLIAPFNNFAVWMIQVAWWDLGLASSANLLANYPNRKEYLKPCTYCVTVNSLLERADRQIFIDDTVLPSTDQGWSPPRKQSFNVQYICSIKELKKPANFVQAVLVAGFGLFGTFWACYNLFWTTFGTYFGSERTRRVFADDYTPTPTPSSPGNGAYDPSKATPLSTTSAPYTQPSGYAVPYDPQQGYQQQQGHQQQQYQQTQQYQSPQAWKV